MPIGLRIFDPNENRVMLDYTDRVGAVIGSFDTTGAASGSFTDPATIGRELFTFMMYIGSSANFTGGCLVTHNPANGAISWQYHASGFAGLEEMRKHRVFYGVF